MEWQPIETAPKDGTPIIGGFFKVPWSDSHMKGCIVQCWYQPEFDAFISSCHVMHMAAGYTIDGQSEKLHSPTVEAVSHWLPLPAPPLS